MPEVPSSIASVLLSGQYIRPDGTPLTGTLTFEPPSHLAFATADIISAGSATVELDASGSFMVTLIATDDPGTQPTDWTYTVTERLRHAPGRTYHISLPSTSPTANLADIAPTDPAMGDYVLVAGPAGKDGAAILTGTGAPSNGAGVNGDFYIDTTPGAVKLYGPKASGTWPGSGVTLSGTSLITAVNGKTGNVSLNAADVGAVPSTGGTVTGDLDVTGRLSAAGFALPAIPQAASRPAWRTASWSQIFQTSHGWTATGSGVASSNMNDTTTYCRGTQSAQVITTGTGAVANVRKLASALPDMTGKALRLVFRVSDVTHLNQINVQVGSASLANYFQWRLHTHATTAENQVLSGEWTVMTLSWADVRSAAGTYSINANGVPSTTSGFTDLLIQVVDDNTAAPVTVNLQAVEIISDSSETFPGGVVSITFDDSYASQHTYARPKMDTLGYRGTLYTICDVIGATPSTYLSLPQLQSVQNMSGWEVAGHAYSVATHNAKYNTLSASVVEDDIRRTRLWMIANGFTSDSFAYPGGWFSRTTDNVSIEALTCRYFSSGRGISSADTLESFPPPAPFRMRSITGIGSLAGGAARGLPANLTGTGGSLDRCQAESNWTILTFHEIVTGTATTTNQCSQADFNSIMDAIAARGIPVLPVGSVLRRYS
ncbi:polysaccharide deacetylase family protein [Streptomyces sp. NBC_00076]|uniref:polysaccharide deacetylase family protein n=1 Tax=Streptomyces sp. NBC_00076 TaxID=2975642 RepID=UPI0032431B51